MIKKNEIAKIRLIAQIALLESVYPAIRKVVFKYEYSKGHLLLRYYLDREPRESDKKNAERVKGEIILALENPGDFEIKEECIYSNEPGNKLDPLNGILYARREYDLDEVL